LRLARVAEPSCRLGQLRLSKCRLTEEEEGEVKLTHEMNVALTYLLSFLVRKSLMPVPLGLHQQLIHDINQLPARRLDQ
jgi:hypothetical protein